MAAISRCGRFLLPEKIERQLSELNDPPGVDVAYSPVILEHWEEHRPIRHETVPIPFDDLWVNLIRWLLPQTGAAFWRRSTIIDVGGWKIDQPCCQEHELYLRLLTANKYFRFCPTPGAVYRQWSSQTVCRRDPLRTALQRLAIVDAAERHLVELDALTEERRDAIACTRLETARTLFQLDRGAALQVASSAKRHPRHQLPASPASPRLSVDVQPCGIPHRRNPRRGRPTMARIWRAGHRNSPRPRDLGPIRARHETGEISVASASR